MQNLAELFDERLARRVRADGFRRRPVAAHDAIWAGQGELRNAVGVFHQELRVAVKDRLARVVPHLAYDAGEQDPFASDNDVRLEPAHAVGELLDVMMPT